jgi:hypothetical protein
MSVNRPAQPDNSGPQDPRVVDLRALDGGGWTRRRVLHASAVVGAGIAVAVLAFVLAKPAMEQSPTGGGGGVAQER